jgi:hypothetical protein
VRGNTNVAVAFDGSSTGHNGHQYSDIACDDAEG